MSFPQELLKVILIFALIPLVLKLLAKIQILPFFIYGIIAESIFPAWVAEHHTLHVVILTLCVLYAVLYWVGKLVRWIQEERMTRSYLLATATPLYRTSAAPEPQYPECQPNMPNISEYDDDDYWYDR